MPELSEDAITSDGSDSTYYNILPLDIPLDRVFDVQWNPPGYPELRASGLQPPVGDLAEQRNGHYTFIMNQESGVMGLARQQTDGTVCEVFDSVHFRAISEEVLMMEGTHGSESWLDREDLPVAAGFGTLIKGMNIPAGEGGGTWSTASIMKSETTPEKWLSQNFQQQDGSTVRVIEGPIKRCSPHPFFQGFPPAKDEWKNDHTPPYNNNITPQDTTTCGDIKSESECEDSEGCAWAFTRGFIGCTTRPLVGTNWRLKEIRGVEAQEEQQELFFNTVESLSGFDGCSSFSAEWQRVPARSIRNRKPRISITMGMGTLRFCLELTDEQQQQQNAFMSILGSTALAYTISVDGQELSIGQPNYPPEMVLTRIPTPVESNERLIGTSWTATDIVYPGDNSQLVPVLKDHPVILSFTPDSMITGSTGVNEFFASVVSMDEWEFQVTNVGQTLIGHESKPVRRQEDAIMSIIGNNGGPYDVNTLPYTLFEERIGDKWTQVLVLGSLVKPLARFVTV